MGTNTGAHKNQNKPRSGSGETRAHFDALSFTDVDDAWGSWQYERWPCGRRNPKQVPPSNEGSFARSEEILDAANGSVALLAVVPNMAAAGQRQRQRTHTHTYAHIHKRRTDCPRLERAATRHSLTAPRELFFAALSTRLATKRATKLDSQSVLEHFNQAVIVHARTSRSTRVPYRLAIIRAEKRVTKFCQYLFIAIVCTAHLNLDKDLLSEAKTRLAVACVLVAARAAPPTPSATRVPSPARLQKNVKHDASTTKLPEVAVFLDVRVHVVNSRCGDETTRLAPPPFVGDVPRQQLLLYVWPKVLPQLALWR